MVDDAIACWRKAIELNPKLAAFHYDLGLAQAKQNRLDDAIACYRKAIELNPKFVPAYQRLAAILLSQQRDFDGAIEVIQKVISLQPDLAAPHVNLGRALSSKGREREAIASFRNALRIEPTLAQAHLSLAHLLTTCSDPRLRDPREALEAAQKAVELAPQLAEAWLVLGWAQYRAGDGKASIEALAKSIALPTSPPGGAARQWFLLAMAHWQLEDKDEARRWYDKAMQWMDQQKVPNEELGRLRVEASELIRPK
jgi:superkiller protein 3